MDKYQERYLKHQARKKKMLSPSFKPKHKDHCIDPKFWDVIRRRKSIRVFGSEDIDIDGLTSAFGYMPSSCDRKPLHYKLIEGADDKALLGGLLVGGVGWVHRSKYIMLLFADMEAYKSPAEKDFMPYLDAGVAVEHLYLTAEALNIAVCYVNPNIREENKEIFNKRFNKQKLLYVGAMILGSYKLIK